MDSQKGNNYAQVLIFHMSERNRWTTNKYCYASAAASI